MGRSGAFVVLSLALATGCLQKPDRPGASLDGAPADASVPDDAADAAGLDGPAADAAVDAAPSCGTCYGVGNASGEPLACTQPNDYCLGAAPYVEQTDLCACTFPEPRVYIYPGAAPRINIAILTQSSAAEDYMDIGGTCRRATYICSTVVTCAGVVGTVNVWESVPVTSTQVLLETYSDANCSLGPRRSILVNL